MNRVVAAVVFAGLISVGAAYGQPTCKKDTYEARVIPSSEMSADFREGLSPAFRFALTPRSFPFQAVQRVGETCMRATFEANGETYRIYGGMIGDSPPRLAIGPDPRKIAYIALGPPPDLALKWLRDGGKGGLSFRDGGITILAVTNGDLRDVYVLFDEIPGDAQLVTSFRDALEGRLPKLATFDTVWGDTEFAAQ